MEHRHYLSPLFDPSSVLVVVEDESPLAWVLRAIERATASACRSALVRLSQPQRYEDVPPAVDSGQAPVPGFDLALITVARDKVAEAIAVAARHRCRSAVVIASGASMHEARQWCDSARNDAMRVLGPGTMGFVRPSIGLDASRMGAIARDGNVALVSQSGVLAGAMLDWAAATVIGFSLVVSLGAEGDVDIAQVLDFLANDHRTKSVVLYLEAVRDSRAFMSALRALASVKPVVVLKGQRDDRSRRVAATHSGAICGSDAVYAAALRRAGAVQIRIMTQLFTAARILASNTWPVNRRIAVLSNGNGPAVLAADMAMSNGIELPELLPETRRALASRLPGIEIENPLCLGVDAGGEQYSSAIEVLSRDPGFDCVLVMVGAHASLDAKAITDAVIAAPRERRTQVYACWMGDRSVRPHWDALDAAGIPVFRTPEAAVDAYATVATFHRNQQLLQQTPRALSTMQAPDLDAARAIFERARAQGRQVLGEIESKELLHAFHVPVTRAVIVFSPAEAIDVAERIGFPVVMKIASSDISHKSDVGGVALDVRNAHEVRAQYAAILDAVRRANPGAIVDGITLQPMHVSANGRELYAGVSRDPSFGPVIAFGAGGTRIEVVRDSALEFPPLNRFLARRLIERTRIAETLGEFRGNPSLDLEPLETLLVRVSEMVCELPWIAQMDINPVIADARGVIAVDARVVIDLSSDRPHARHSHLAILPYPAHLTQRRTAPDGRFYTIRPIRPEDADRLQAFVRALSEQSRYFRFLSVLAELTPRMLARYTQIDYDRELALVAVVAPDESGGDEQIIGVVRYLLNPDGASGEFAVAIADGWQGRQLGSTLMRSIIDAARDKGLRSIEGYVLASNAKMLGLMSYLGFAIDAWPEDPSMKRATMRLA